LLIAGLGLGQGTIFLVQTLLVAAGEYELLAAFGAHYSFAILGILLVDAGASTILARTVAHLSGGQTSRDDAWRTFCEMSAIRLLIASLIGIAAAVYALGFASDGFSRWYVILAIPGLLFWTINAVGILDGLRLSGVSGITGSAAHVVTAIGLVLAWHRSIEVAGAILGGAFSLGYLLTLSAQWIALVREGWVPHLHKVTRAGLVRSLKDGSALLFQLVPGQINMRVQLVLSAVYLDTETTALFIYAKQVVTALTQIIGFILRVEFPGLVEKVAASGKQSFGSILDAQKMALYCAVVFTLGATGVSGIAALVPDFSLHRTATIMVSFAPTTLTLSLSMMMIQALAALGAYGVIARALAIGSAVGIFVSYMLVSTLHVYAFALGEVTFHLVGMYIVYRYLRHPG
jgi:O-antigen/teichoic acid export membrane protein